MATPEQSLSRDSEQGTTFLELFFDLVFVLAVTQLSQRLYGHLGLGSWWRCGFLLLVLWWGWVYTTWMTNWFNPDSVAVRLVLLFGMFASLAVAVAIPRAFSSRGLLFAGGYVALQWARNGFIVFATRPTNPLHVAFRRILAWSVSVGLIWIAGALIHGPLRVAIWGLALLLDYAGPFLGHPTPGLGRTSMDDWQVEHSHFAERIQAFVLIALGESIVTTGAAAAARHHLGAGNDLALVLAFGLGAVLWWLYFDQVAHRSAADFEEADEAAAELGRDAFTYLHIPIVAGIIVSAVGAEIVIARPMSAPTQGELVALAAGPVLYLAGHLAFRLRMIGTVAWGRLAAAVCVGLAVAALGLLGAPGWSLTLVTVVILGTLAAGETAQRLRAPRPSSLP